MWMATAYQWLRTAGLTHMSLVLSNGFNYNHLLSFIDAFQLAYSVIIFSTYIANNIYCWAVKMTLSIVLFQILFYFSASSYSFRLHLSPPVYPVSSFLLASEVLSFSCLSILLTLSHMRGWGLLVPLTWTRHL